MSIWNSSKRGFRVRQLVSNIALFVLLGHVVFGCCFHHAHHCEADCCSAPSELAGNCPCEYHGDRTYRAHLGTDSVGCTGESDHSVTPHHQSHEPSPSRHECEGHTCVFLGAGRPLTVFPASQLRSIDAPCSVGAESGSPIVGQWVAASSSCSTPTGSVRAHLLYQILLI